jgi:hypothetical protein
MTNVSAKTRILGPLSALPMFSDHYDFLEKILVFFKIYTFSEGHVIQEEGAQLMELFWILEGSCKVQQSVPFVLRAKKQKGKSNVEAYDETILLKKGDKKVDLELETQELYPGESFPPFPLLGDLETTKYLGPASVQKDQYVEFFAKLKVDNKLTYSKTNVVAGGVVVVASIQFNDFVQLAPKNILYELIFNPSLITHSIEKLQGEFLEQQSWKDHRKLIVGESKMK